MKSFGLISTCIGSFEPDLGTCYSFKFYGVVDGHTISKVSAWSVDGHHITVGKDYFVQLTDAHLSGAELLGTIRRVKEL